MPSSVFTVAVLLSAVAPESTAVATSVPAGAAGGVTVPAALPAADVAAFDPALDASPGSDSVSLWSSSSFRDYNGGLL